MLELIAQNLAPIMFAALVVFLLLGYPVAFSLAAVGMIFFVLGVFLAPYSGGAVNLSWPLMRTLPERIYGVMTNETLLAIPFPGGAGAGASRLCGQRPSVTGFAPGL